MQGPQGPDRWSGPSPYPRQVSARRLLSAGAVRASRQHATQAPALSHRASVRHQHAGNRPLMNPRQTAEGTKPRTSAMPRVSLTQSLDAAVADAAAPLSRLLNLRCDGVPRRRQPYAWAVASPAHAGGVDGRTHAQDPHPGVAMDSFALRQRTALVGAIATDARKQSETALLALWRKAVPRTRRGGQRRPVDRRTPRPNIPPSRTGSCASGR